MEQTGVTRVPEPTYKVIVDVQEQYSLWPDEAEDPLGWSESGGRGSLGECLGHIAAFWRGEAPADSAFTVLVNENNMLAVSLAAAERPLNWESTGFEGALDECLAYIGEAWRGRGPVPIPLQSPA
jgi:MbtH protein